MERKKDLNSIFFLVLKTIRCLRFLFRYREKQKKSILDNNPENRLTSKIQFLFSLWLKSYSFEIVSSYASIKSTTTDIEKIKVFPTRRRLTNLIIINDVQVVRL